MSKVIIRPSLEALQQAIAEKTVTGLVSPSFLISPPAVKHLERIPPAVLALMLPTWKHVWFPRRPLHFTVLEGVFVTREGLVLQPDGSVMPETVAQHSAAEVEAGQNAVRALSFGGHPRLSGNVVLCRKSGNGTYGHWLVELLPVAYLASQWPERLRFLIQTLPSGPMSVLIRQTLGSLGLSGDTIVSAGADPVWVERLIVVHGLSHHGEYMSPLAVDCLQSISDRIEPAGTEAIFITRPPGAGRRLVNETAILKEAEKAGFAVLDPSTMSFSAQVAAFKAARRIVGVMGSALANLAFASEGANVSILAPAMMPDTFFWFLCHHRRLNMEEIRCIKKPSTCRDTLSADLQLDEGDAKDLFARKLPQHAMHIPLFVEEFYSAHNPDLLAVGGDLLAHYMETGWKEGRRPSQSFNGNRYLETYEDVRASGLNPLTHFMLHGREEGRSPFDDT